MPSNNTRISSISWKARDLWIEDTTTDIPNDPFTKEQGINIEVAKDMEENSRNAMIIVSKRISLGLSRGGLKKSM